MEDYRGPYGQKQCPRRGCNQSQMPHVQKWKAQQRIVCLCGVAGPWKIRREDSVDGWNGLPREPLYSKERPTKPGPCWCRSHQGFEAIVDLTEEDIVGLTPTLACYEMYCPIPKPPTPKKGRK